jgi:hypothetical protein
VFPPDLVSQYKSDGAAMVKAQGNFNAEWNKVALGKGDVKKLMSTYDIYSLAFGALVESNTQIEALLEVDAAGKAAAWLILLGGLAKFTLGRQLHERMMALKAALEKAEGEVSDAKWKRDLNVALSVVTLVIAPEEGIGEVIVAAGSIGAHSIIDEALGKGSGKGKVVFIVGDGVALIPKASAAAKKFTGVAATFITAKFDQDEVNEAQEVVDGLRPLFQDAVKACDDFINGIMPYDAKLRQLDAGLKALSAAINQALTRSSDAAKTYVAIKNAIKKVM